MASGLVPLALGLIACGSTDGDWSEPTDTISQAVQCANIEDEDEWEWGRGAHLVRDFYKYQKARVTGVIRPVPSKYGGRWSSSGTYANCGATFISPRYAVTAAHCVKYANLPIRYPNPGYWDYPLLIEEYDTQDLTTSAFNKQSLVTWDPDHPSNMSWDRAYTMNEGDGYRIVRSNYCYVRARCDQTGPDTEDCPFSTTVDIALLYCHWRPDNPYQGQTPEWATVYTKGRSNGSSVNVFWFHEVPALANIENPPNYSFWPPNNDDYYFKSLPKTFAQDNWHYNGKPGFSHQYLPLVSWRDPNGDLYKQVHIESGEKLVDTNVPTCEGMSGSGVFTGHWSDARLLGPVSESRGNGMPGTRLCDTTFNDPVDTARMAYVHWKWTRKIEQMAEVQADRN